MIWVPIVLGLFKFTVLAATIFVSLKSHRDGEREQKRLNEARGQHPHGEHVPHASQPDLKKASA
ncbi:hypothetical protein [Mangrovicoccus ximenensis]|uniref:hypothetical protein n=1 Tax=Mangrovicoccus ximenensis TaxID=1911570 RepID=UPI000D3B579B|nr:hypothetical protein [Mangrovicoccus ximenensis]